MKGDEKVFLWSFLTVEGYFVHFLTFSGGMSVSESSVGIRIASDSRMISSRCKHPAKSWIFEMTSGLLSPEELVCNRSLICWTSSGLWTLGTNKASKWKFVTIFVAYFKRRTWKNSFDIIKIDYKDTSCKISLNVSGLSDSKIQ